MESKSSDSDFEVIWGAASIGAEINVPPRRAFYLLENGLIRGAKKVGGKPDKKGRHRGGRWSIVRGVLRRQFLPEDAEA